MRRPAFEAGPAVSPPDRRAVAYGHLRHSPSFVDHDGSRGQVSWVAPDPDPGDPDPGGPQWWVYLGLDLSWQPCDDEAQALSVRGMPAAQAADWAEKRYYAELEAAMDRAEAAEDWGTPRA